MEKKKTDNEKVMFEEEVVDNPSQEQSSKDASDNVADESFENNDNLSQVSDAAAVWQDKYVRLSAEFDNYRKRTLKEKLDIAASGGEDVVKSLLVVLDDFDRAINAAGATKDVAAVKEGVVLIRQKMLDTLSQKGLKEIEAIDEPFDTDLHEAVAKLPVEGDKKGRIVDVVQKGYKLKDKVIRFAKVVVGE